MNSTRPAATPSARREDPRDRIAATLTQRLRISSRATRSSSFAGIALVCALLVTGCSTATQGTAAVELPEIAGLRTVEDDFLSSGQPTREDLEALSRAGFRTVVDLRTEAEDRGFDEAAAVEELGMSYLNIPVSGLPLDPEAVDALGAALRSAERPILVHCRSGNRVGAYYALHLSEAHGTPADEALQRGLDAGMRSEALIEAVRAALNEETDDED